MVEQERIFKYALITWDISVVAQWIVLASENISQTNLTQYLSVQTFTTFSGHRPILLKIL